MRESPSDFSPEQQRSSKRAATVQQPSSSASSSGGQLLQNGFTKIPLPSTRLGRTLSAPIPTKNLYDQFSDGALTNSLIANSSPEENSGLNSVPVRTQPSQQPQKPLYRTYSEPIPAASQAVATSATPRPPEAGKVMYPAGRGIQESPDAKSFRRMKDRMREMRKWWDEVITEGEEEDASGSDNDDNHSPSNDDCEASQGTTEKGSENEEATHDQEAVWVERKGEVLILHFKCPCSKSYQILPSENNCYLQALLFLISKSKDSCC
ncbi:OLC1v1012690C1 [Oldenlandia corymbosa var. corymbosa]|uniref:OLC1v1012690C1 n=1 Tax=Oldenlandia corymbosa var. corymbosa TaxID=529605 RepID=A0AAV1DZJ0_OLDCO|nr:OLC1v1012690C1 [Oldenlandia corymbosa var. corymbosa]